MCGIPSLLLAIFLGASALEGPLVVKQVALYQNERGEYSVGIAVAKADRPDVPVAVLFYRISLEKPDDIALLEKTPERRFLVEACVPR